MSALLCGIVAVAGYPAYRNRDRLLKLTAAEKRALFSPFIFPVVITAWGVVVWWPSHNGAAVPWLLETTKWILLLYPTLCAFSIWRARGYRWFAVALIPLSFFTSLFAAAFAIASVTGD